MRLPSSGGGMRVRLSADVLKSDLVRRIEEISGQNLLGCYQCGECLAGCPVAFAMDMLPSQVIRLVQLSEVEEALESETIWFCVASQRLRRRALRLVKASWWTPIYKLASPMSTPLAMWLKRWIRSWAKEH